MSAASGNQWPAVTQGQPTVKAAKSPIGRHADKQVLVPHVLVTNDRLE